MKRVARRADGWLPVHVPETGTFDPASINEPLTRIRALAQEAGRDPSELGAILRIYPMSTESLASVIDTIAAAQRDTAVDHVFVEMMNLAHTVDQSLDTADHILEAARC